MPESMEQLLWWMLNGCLLIILWFIRSELKNIREELRRSHKNYHNMYTWMVQQNNRCNMLHPDAQPLQPPQWEE